MDSTAGAVENEADEDDLKAAENAKSKQSATPRKSRADSINMDALFAHRIIYKYKAPENKKHKQIRLPSINGRNGSKTTESGSSDSDNTALRCSDSPSDLKFIGSVNSWKKSFKNSKSPCEGYFLHETPANFVEMCIAGLSEYIVRSEVVLTGVGYKRVESLTVNRMPLCKYGENIS